MRIDKRLHLVIPIYADEEGGDIVAHVHSSPISEAVIDRYFMVLGQTYSAIFSQGLGLAGGPPHAMRVLKAIATERGKWHDDSKTGEVGVENGLVEEMRRLTMVEAMKDGKWVDMPLAVAVAQGVLSPDDKTEVENAIAFFTAASATLGRAQRAGMLRAAAELWGAEISSLSFTEWRSSLKTSTPAGNTGEKPPAPAKDDKPPANAVVAGKPRSVPV
jgi:hypothetical protein